MSGNFGLLESGFAKKILVILFLALSIYLVNVFIAVIIVSKNSDINFMLKMYGRESINGCDSNYKKLEYGVFDPIGFYANKNYWIADYRVSLHSFSVEKCSMDIFSEMKKYDSYVTVAVVDDNSKVVFYIKSFK